MELQCENCQTNISIDPEQMGTEITCPACGHRLNLPELPAEIADALDKKLEEESSIKPNRDGDHHVAEAMLEEPASKETTMWREKLAASFQAANVSNIKRTETEYEITRRSDLESGIDSILDYFSIKKVQAFDEYYKTVSNIGSFSILIFGLLALTECLILTSKQGDAKYLIFGIIGFLSSFGLYYLAVKFSRTGLALIRSTDLVFYTRDMHHAFGLINILLTLFMLLLGGYVGISEKRFFYALLFFISSAGTAHAAILFMSPNVLNTRIAKKEATAGDTGLSMIGCVIRVSMLSSGILLTSVFVFGIMCLYLIFNTFNNTDPQLIKFAVICSCVTVIAVSPLLSYLVCLFYRIFLDLYKVIFQISARLGFFLDSLCSSDE